VVLNLSEQRDGSFLVGKAVTQHEGHEVSEEMFITYRNKNIWKLTPDQEDSVMQMLCQGVKIPEITKQRSHLTGRQYEHKNVYRVIKKIKAERVKVNCETGEEVLEYMGQEIPTQGLGLQERDCQIPVRGHTRDLTLSPDETEEVFEAMKAGADVGVLTALLIHLTGIQFTKKDALVKMRAIKKCRF
jgi:hypothetical protein